MRYLFLLVSTLVIAGFGYATEVVPIANFDSSRYLGSWYEIARLPNRFERHCTLPITANYSINPDDDKQLIVINKCNTKSNEFDVATGVADFVESSTVGKLEVTFMPKWLRWLPFSRGDYWVLYTDYDNISVVGSPDLDYLWVLARTQHIDTKQLNQALRVAKSQGFNLTKLIYNYSVGSSAVDNTESIQLK